MGSRSQSMRRTGQTAQFMTRSFDGGFSFDRPIRVADVVDVGAFDLSRPSPAVDCPATFGDTDVFALQLAPS